MRTINRAVGLVAVAAVLTVNAHALSVYGNDWRLNLSGNLLVPSMGFSTTVSVTNASVEIIQTATNSYQLQHQLPSGFNPSTLVLTGNINPLPTPQTTILAAGYPLIEVPAGAILPMALRFHGVTAIANGDIVGINNAVIEAYGPRVWRIVDNNGPNFVVAGNIQAQIGPNQWLDLGPGFLTLTDWELIRPVPEPASLIALATALTSLVGLRRRTCR
ncbi:MAG: PEP-CTERM sorting domain-containing protein [Fimbriimonadales bacterium]|nr:PEP-CTERM sorting domain-containing protein [Fimbriimonadales bacterium]MDW8051008.1 PEP-CTERM sorting domain-containing protein [Armatimonadota bacterium]